MTNFLWRAVDSAQWCYSLSNVPTALFLAREAEAGVFNGEIFGVMISSWNQKGFSLLDVRM